MVSSLQIFTVNTVGYLGTSIHFEQLEIAKLYLFGEVQFLHLLLLTMLLDIVTGLFKAWRNENIWSRKSLVGYARKLLVLVVVILANVIDQVLSLGGAVANATVLFYIASESLSIIENLVQIGVPIPKFIVEKLKIIAPDNENITENSREKNARK